MVLAAAASMFFLCDPSIPWKDWMPWWGGEKEDRVRKESGRRIVEREDDRGTEREGGGRGREELKLILVN